MEQKRVLVVDDERDICNLLKERLNSAGYDVEMATTAKSGLEKAYEFEPHVIMLDIRMPMTDGFSVARFIHNDPDLCRIPVILFTGEPVLGLPEKCQDVGAVDYLTKPFNAQELLAKLEEVITKYPADSSEDGPTVEFK